MKTVFILGAGASAQAGAPLMNDFLDRAHDLMDQGVQGAYAAKPEFDMVFDAMAELQAIQAKSYLNLSNLEVLFGAIEMGRMVNKLGDRTPNQITELRNALIKVIYTTLDFSIRFQAPTGDTRPPEPYERFVDIVSESIAKRFHVVSDLALLTFNYDVCLEYALEFKGLPYCHWTDGVGEEGSVPLLDK